jgi:hypothetical protein
MRTANIFHSGAGRILTNETAYGNYRFFEVFLIRRIGADGNA